MVTNVTRRNKREIDIAILDLQKRGFKLIYGPAEQKAQLTQRGDYNYKRGRYQSISMSVASCWIAKLERAES
jgi:hypothetical protein